LYAARLQKIQYCTHYGSAVLSTLRRKIGYVIDHKYVK